MTINGWHNAVDLLFTSNSFDTTLANLGGGGGPL
jgi:hypothetical protein